MRKIILTAILLVAATASPLALADAPSFNYVQVTGQHANAQAAHGWGWGAAASFNPAGGWFVSGHYRHVRDLAGSGEDANAWRTDAGYAWKFAGMLAAYGEVGWSKQSVASFDDSGMHYEVGLRARLPLVQLEGAVGRYQRNGGFNEYSATALFHVLPFTYVGVGYVSDQYSHGNDNRWQAGIRLTF